MAACRRDPIATARSIVWLVSHRSIITILDSLMFPFQIRGSSIRRQIFSEILESLHYVDNLQLLRDVITCWSSTLLMIECVLYLRPVSAIYISCWPCSHQLIEGN